VPDIILRQDQAQLKQAALNGYSAGARHVLAVLATGGGKSVVVSDIVLDNERAGLRQTVLAHRQELVGQMSMHVARRGIKHRIIGPKTAIAQIIAAHRAEFNYSFYSPTANCTVGSVDTLISRADELSSWAVQQDFWTIDEAHHVLRENKWGRAVNMFTNARGLGVTATPSRADGKGLGSGSNNDGVFDLMVEGLPMRDLINIGALADYEIACPTSDIEIDDSAITDGGDFSPKKLAAAAHASHIVGDVVTQYQIYSYGKRAIVFATDVETSNEIAKKFNEAGIPAGSVSAKSPDHVRDDYVKRFRDGRFWVLVNVDLFGEGFDVPATDTVIMARPTASLAVYLQQFGRAMRMSPGKSHGLIIDQVSNWKRHGFPDKPRVWTLARRDRRAKSDDPDDIPLTTCKNCSRPYERFHALCPYCGHVPVPAYVERSLPVIDGDLTLLDRTILEEMRRATQLESPADVAQRVAMVAGDRAAAAQAQNRIERIQAQQALSDAIAHWAGYQRHLGRADGETYRRFYLTTGVDVLTALTLPRSEMETLTARVKGWRQ